MSSFESAASTKSNTPEYERQKFPIRRLEVSIQKFLKVIEIDLERLHQHRLNLEKFNRLSDWDSQHKENVNATRTVQQIKANLKEIERTRLQVMDEDLDKFDSKTRPMMHHAISAIQEYIGASVNETVSTDSTDRNELSPLIESNIQRSSSENLSLSGHMTLQVQPMPEHSEALESWENLEESLLELNTMIHEFSTIVQDQQEKVDRIEDNIEKAHDSVQKGTFDLGKASKYKSLIFPVVGAVIGTAVAGPVGLFAGAKLGGLAGVVGGSALGFVGGKIVKKRQDKITDLELKNMSAKRSTSLPDLKLDDNIDKGADKDDGFSKLSDKCTE